MLEWLLNSSFCDPAEFVSKAPRASLRLNHVEQATQAYKNDEAVKPYLDEAEGAQTGNGTVQLSKAAIIPAARRLLYCDTEEQQVEEPKNKRIEQRFGSFVYTLRSSGNSVRILAYDGSDSNVVIPEQIEDHVVSALASNLFFGHDELEEVSMPDTVEYLGHHVFEKCTNLKKVRLSASLAHVGPGVFNYCDKMETLVITAPIVSVESKLFSSLNVEEIEFGPLVRQVDSLDFAICNVKRISVDGENECLRTDGAALFNLDGTQLLHMIVPLSFYCVPQGCVSIGDRAFDSLRSLQKITFPSSLKNIGRLAFAKTSIASIELPEGFEYIGEKAFFHCSSLVEVVLPNTLKTIELEAFSYTGLKRIELGASVETLGFCAFNKTTLQENIAKGTLRVSNENQILHVDNCGGVYINCVFKELIGLVSSYEVADGTRSVAPGACKRHATLARITLPEGLTEIGESAFRSNRRLREVQLPESLQTIGRRAFVDTSIRELHISANVCSIGENALIVQGENQLTPTHPLTSIDLDSDNAKFYIESGLFCEKNAAKDGGDALLVYLDNEPIVHIPTAVTQINNLAFCGSSHMEELWMHNHIQSICMGALSTKRALNTLHIQFAEPVQGVSEVHLKMPSYTSRFRSMMPLFETRDEMTRFNFEYYDTWVACSTSISELASAAIERMKCPVRLCMRCAELYEGIFTRKASDICHHFANQADLAALKQLYDWGFLSDEYIQNELDLSIDRGQAHITACLFELQRLVHPTPSNLDFSL